MEIDRYYPEIKVGIEFQGIQHYRPTAQLGQNRESFLSQVRRDTEKINLAAKQGVKIFALGLANLKPQPSPPPPPPLSPPKELNF